MFEFLNETNPHQAISGVYYAVRALKHRYNSEDFDALRVRGAASEPSADELAIARRALTEIERVEQREIPALSQGQAYDYIGQLVDSLQSVLKQRWQYDEERGRQLLEQLRQEQPFASQSGA